jgi:hypothetical protein
MKSLVAALAIVLLSCSVASAAWVVVAPPPMAYSYWPVGPVYAHPHRVYAYPYYAVAAPVVVDPAPLVGPAAVYYPGPAVVRARVYYRGQPVRNAVRAVVP